MTDTDPLTTYLAAHDAPCPGCYRNMRGQVGSECPACGTKLRLSEVRVWHEAHGDAIGDPIPQGTEDELASLAAYLGQTNAVCIQCGYLLRNLLTNRCPECRALLIESEIRYRDEIDREGWATTRPQYPAQGGIGVILALGIAAIVTMIVIVAF